MGPDDDQYGLTHEEMKNLLFADHYGSGQKKIWELLKGQGKPASWHYLMLGGPLHGQFIQTHGDFQFQCFIPPKPSLAKYFGEFSYELPKEEVFVYVQKKIHVPGLGEKIPVYYPDDTHYNDQDQLLGQWLKENMGPQTKPTPKHTVAPYGNFGGQIGIGTVTNTNVAPIKTEPRKDGLQITIGGRTVVWEDLSANQVAGLMQWAAQSLGPGEDAA